MLYVFLSAPDVPAASVSDMCLQRSFATHPAFPDCLSSLLSSPQTDTCCSASKKKTAQSGPGYERNDKPNDEEMIGYTAPYKIADILFSSSLLIISVNECM